MFKKIFTFMIALTMAALLNANISESQTTKKSAYPKFSISPVVGFQFPVGSLNDSYKASFNAGLDLTLSLNRETAIYLKGGYYDMPRSGEVGSNASYVEISAGPRYVFTSPKISAQFFLEGGIGAYIFTAKEYTLPGLVIPSTTSTSFGVNVGPGAIIPVSDAMDIIIKSKLHYTFQTGGSHTFIATVLGLNFNL